MSYALVLQLHCHTCRSLRPYLSASDCNAIRSLDADVTDRYHVDVRYWVLQYLVSSVNNQDIHELSCHSNVLRMKRKETALVSKDGFAPSVVIDRCCYVLLTVVREKKERKENNGALRPWVPSPLGEDQQSNDIGTFPKHSTYSTLTLIIYTSYLSRSSFHHAWFMHVSEHWLHLCVQSGKLQRWGRLHGRCGFGDSYIKISKKSLDPTYVIHESWISFLWEDMFATL